MAIARSTRRNGRSPDNAPGPLDMEARLSLIKIGKGVIASLSTNDSISNSKKNSNKFPTSGFANPALLN